MQKRTKPLGTGKPEKSIFLAFYWHKFNHTLAGSLQALPIKVITSMFGDVGRTFQEGAIYLISSISSISYIGEGF
jgi:hypothetical protein